MSFLEYHYPLFRPPSEADSFILQITLGCSHNQCAFCSMYRGKIFRPQSMEIIEKNIQQGLSFYGTSLQRIFLADGNAMCLSTSRLVSILDRLHAAFPKLQRIGIYANARDVLSKTKEDLQELRQRKLRIIYLGLESGDEETLQKVHKGSTAEEMVTAVKQAQENGINASVMVLIGLAGKERSLIHARASAQIINQMEPFYTALLTYTPTPDSPLFEAIHEGKWNLPTAKETLLEIKTLVADLNCRTYFTCNHASNYLPLKGKMPSAKGQILALLEEALAGEIPLKPDFLRGL